MRRIARDLRLVQLRRKKTLRDDRLAQAADVFAERGARERRVRLQLERRAHLCELRGVEARDVNVELVNVGLRAQSNVVSNGRLRAARIERLLISDVGLIETVIA